MASPNEKFKQAAWMYLLYGVLYLIGAIYLASQGFGARGMRTGAGIGWFIFGALFVVLIPFLLYRPWELHFVFRDSGRIVRLFHRHLFAKILTILIVIRAFGVGRVMINPAHPAVPLPGGGELSMSLGAAIFLLITLVTGIMVARAAWIPYTAEP